MNQRGRRSASSLSIVSAPESARPQPPATLSEPAKQVWRDTVGAFRPDWFQGCGPILGCYCETAVTACQIADALSACSLQDERWPELVKLHCAVVSSFCNIGTKLRITPQSSRDSRHAKLASITGGRPWEDEDSEPPEPPVQKN